MLIFFDGQEAINGPAEMILECNIYYLFIYLFLPCVLSMCVCGSKHPYVFTDQSVSMSLFSFTSLCKYAKMLNNIFSDGKTSPRISIFLLPEL